MSAVLSSVGMAFEAGGWTGGGGGSDVLREVAQVRGALYC